MKPTNLIWHIFRKDVKLLWPFVLLATGIHFASARVRYLLDHLGFDRTLAAFSQLLVPATVLAAALLITAAVHQDAIPGICQDWLVRPIQRKDLLIAKLLFALLMAQGPIFLADLVQGLVNGFPIGQSFSAAATRGLMFLGVVTLPTLALSSVTRNMTETVIGAVAASVGAGTFDVLVNSDRSPIWPTSATGLEWIARCAVITVLLLGASAILTVQYFRRRTVLARWLTLGVASFAFLAQFVPWQVAFALQQRLAAAPSSSRTIVPAFVPKLGRFRLPQGISRNSVVGSQGNTRDEASTVYLPIHLGGLPENVVLNADISEVRLVTPNGKVLYRGFADDLLIRKDDRLAPTHFTIGSRSVRFSKEVTTEDLSVPRDGEAWIYHGISLPRGLYEHIKNQVLHLEIDYSWTLFGSTSYPLPALGANQRIPGVGRCTTKMDEDGDDVELHCLQAGRWSFCGSAFLEHESSGRRNPPTFICKPHYAPYFDQLIPDGLARFGVGVRFHDLSGLTKYPVDISRLPQSRVVLRVYEPEDHFTRRLVVPEIRLIDWESLEHNQLAENR